MALRSCDEGRSLEAHCPETCRCPFFNDTTKGRAWAGNLPAETRMGKFDFVFSRGPVECRQRLPDSGDQTIGNLSAREEATFPLSSACLFGKSRSAVGAMDFGRMFYENIMKGRRELCASQQEGSSSASVR